MRTGKVRWDNTTSASNNWRCVRRKLVCSEFGLGVCVSSLYFTGQSFLVRWVWVCFRKRRAKRNLGKIIIKKEEKGLGSEA